MASTTEKPRTRIEEYIYRMKWRFYIPLILMLLCGFALYKWEKGKKLIFSSTFTLLPSQSSSGGLPGGDLSPLSYILGSSGMGGAGGSDLIPIMASRMFRESITEDTIQWQGKKHLFADILIDSIPPPSAFQKWLNALLYDKMGPPSLKSKISSAAKLLGLSVEIAPHDDPAFMGVTVITYTNISPSLVQLVGESYVAEIQSYYKDKKTEKTRKLYEFYVDRTDSIRRELDGRMKRTAKIEDEDKYRIFARTELPKLENQKESEILAEMYAQMLAMREGALNDYLKDAPTLQILDSPAPPYDVKRPKPYLMLVAGAILGIIFGVLLSVQKLLRQDVFAYLKNALASSEE